MEKPDSIQAGKRLNLKVTSGFLKREVEIPDDCGCTGGGFYEKELTQHGFRGSIIGRWVAIYCNQCDKELYCTPVPN